MAELVKLVADDIEPFDSVHPSTMELYRSLTRRRTTAAGTVTSRADRQPLVAPKSSAGGSTHRRLPTGILLRAAEPASFSPVGPGRNRARLSGRYHSTLLVRRTMSRRWQEALDPSLRSSGRVAHPVPPGVPGLGARARGPGGVDPPGETVEEGGTEQLATHFFVIGPGVEQGLDEGHSGLDDESLGGHGIQPGSDEIGQFDEDHRFAGIVVRFLPYQSHHMGSELRHPIEQGAHQVLALVQAGRLAQLGHIQCRSLLGGLVESAEGSQARPGRRACSGRGYLVPGITNGIAVELPPLGVSGT